MEYLHEIFNGQPVFYTPETKGAGRLFADDFLKMLQSQKNIPPADNILEWCSGPGFIGFSLMAHGWAGRLCLAEAYPPAREAINHTINFNQLMDRVSVYDTNNPALFPKDHKFDLVVANPPYFPNRVMQEEVYKHDSKADPRLYVDENWGLHKQFFANIGQHLSATGRIIFLESTNASHLETFRPMLEGSGLYIQGWAWSCVCGDKMWYLFLGKEDVALPNLRVTA